MNQDLTPVIAWSRHILTGGFSTTRWMVVKHGNDLLQVIQYVDQTWYLIVGGHLKQPGKYASQKSPSTNKGHKLAELPGG